MVASLPPRMPLNATDVEADQHIVRRSREQEGGSWRAQRAVPITKAASLKPMAIRECRQTSRVDEDSCIRRRHRYARRNR